MVFKGIVSVFILIKLEGGRNGQKPVFVYVIIAEIVNWSLYMYALFVTRGNGKLLLTGLHALL